MKIICGSKLSSFIYCINFNLLYIDAFIKYYSMLRFNNILRTLNKMQPNIEATKDHCKFCFQVLQAKFNKQKLPEFPKTFQDHQVPIFVTWLLDGELRGCIGTFAHERLSKVLSQYSLISALQDNRFDPISLQQMPHLSVGVSFLVNFQQNLGPFDWQIGKNGIILHLNRNGREYSATFLPEVAEQQKWDKETTLKYLMSKAGCKLPLQVVEKDIRLTTYESSKVKLTYKEWKEGFKQQKFSQDQK